MVQVHIPIQLMVVLIKVQQHSQVWAQAPILLQPKMQMDAQLLLQLLLLLRQYQP